MGLFLALKPVLGLPEALCVGLSRLGRHWLPAIGIVQTLTGL